MIKMYSVIIMLIMLDEYRTRSLGVQKTTGLKIE
jgi:hypothetical protein